MGISARFCTFSITAHSAEGLGEWAYLGCTVAKECTKFRRDMHIPPNLLGIMHYGWGMCKITHNEPEMRKILSLWKAYVNILHEAW